MNLENFKDPRWRLNNLYKIVNKNAQLVKFKENPIQKILNDSPAPRKMILKARQQGVTTNEVLKQLDCTLFSPNFTACILAHDNDSIAKIFGVVRKAYERLPDEMKPLLDKGGGSMYEMRFTETGSKIYCDLESRGDTIQWLHVSEAAFVKQERLKATLEAVPLDGRVTYETTPNGLDNFFYDLWNSDTVYTKFFFPWFFNAEYQVTPKGLYKPNVEEKKFIKKTKDLYDHEISADQLEFRKLKQTDLGTLFAQEYPEDDYSCFLHSGRSVLDQVFITGLMKKASKPKRVIDDIQIFHERDVKKTYVVGADVSQGIGGDWSACHVICLEDLEEVGFYRGQLSPFLFAKKLKQICDIFTSGHKLPLLAPELNNHGHAVVQELVENIGYPNLYSYKKDQLGWLTTSVTRHLMMDWFLKVLTTNYVKFNSKETLLEARSLVEDKGKIQAPSGKHDDCVISAAIALQMLKEQLDVSSFYNNIEKKILV